MSVAMSVSPPGKHVLDVPVGSLHLHGYGCGQLCLAVRLIESAPAAEMPVHQILPERKQPQINTVCYHALRTAGDHRLELQVTVVARVVSLSICVPLRDCEALVAHAHSVVR